MFVRTCATAGASRPVANHFSIGGILMLEKKIQIGNVRGGVQSGHSPLREALISKKCIFFNIVQKAFDPPPLLFEHLSYFAGGVF